MAQSGRLQEDSLRQAIQLSKADTNRVKLWLQLGQLYAYMPLDLRVDKDTAYVYAQKAKTLSKTLHFAGGFNQSTLLAARSLASSTHANQVAKLLQDQRFRTSSNALLLLSEHYLKKSEDSPAKLDSAMDYAQQTFYQSIRERNKLGQAEAKIILGHLYMLQGNQLESEQCYTQAKLFIEQVPAPFMQAYLWYAFGDGYDRTTTGLPLKISYYERALAIYHRLGDKEAEALVSKSIADMEQAQGHFVQALQRLLEVVRLQRAIHSPKIHYTYDLLGAIYAAMGTYEQALPYALATLENARTTKDTADIASFFYRVARIKEELGQHQSAIRYYQYASASATYSKNDNYAFAIVGPVRIARIMALTQPQQALAFLQRHLRHHRHQKPYLRFLIMSGLGELYLSTHAYALSEQHLLSALQLLKQIRFPLENDKQERFARIYTGLSRLYTAKDQYEKAQVYLKLAFYAAAQRPDATQSKNLQLIAFRLDSLQGNLKSAITHYQRYKTLNDSIFNERKSSQLISFQVQYDTQHKEHELKLQEKNVALLTQRNHAQQASLGLQRTERNALLMSAIMLLAIIGLGYNRFQLKQRSNLQLLGQQQALQNRQQEIDRKNAALEVLVTEKEWLLKEIHHRVKNNLQIVMSLLNSQATSLTDKTALMAIQESQHRVQAMALIHQKIYQSERVAQVSMPAYLQELVTYLREAYEVAQVQFELTVEPIELDIALAVPLGLIVNEALTNSLKYAFPSGQAGHIRLALHRLPDAAYQLEISDDGVGLPPGYVPERSRSLGMKLLYGFGQQLGGELCLSSPPGLTLRLVFQEDSQFLPAITSNYA
jgi:two-component sensor histidine kinase